MFSSWTVPPDSTETELGSSEQEASPSAGKYTGVAGRIAHFAHGNVSLKLFPLVWRIPRSLGIICYDRCVLSEGHKKLLQGLVSHKLTACLSVFYLFLTQKIISILSKGCKPDRFESHNSLKLSFTNNRGLHSIFLECESFLISNSPDILALYETNFDESIDSGNFSVMCYLNLIRKDSSTHMHGFAFYLKERLPLAQDLSLENSTNSYLFPTGFTSPSVLFLFPLSITFSIFVHGFYSISSTTAVLSIIPYTTVFIFEAFKRPS